MFSVAEILEGATGGLLVSIIGTYLHSRRKGAEVLDAALQKDIAQRDGVIVDRDKIVSALRDAQPQRHKQQRVREWLNQMSARERTFIEWLLDHSEIEESLLAKNSPPGDIGRPYEWGLIVKRHEMRGTFGFTMFSVNPDYKDALYAVIHSQ